MHPSLVRAHVQEAVVELGARLKGRGELGVVELRLDADALVLDIGFDHDERKTEIVNEPSLLWLPGGGALTRQQRIPILGRSTTQRLVLRLELDDFDFLPPTATLLTEAGEPLKRWPTALAGGGIVNSHPIYHRPFFCRRGLREYHSHEQHEDDPWARWRDALPLHAIVLELLTDLRLRWQYAA